MSDQQEKLAAQLPAIVAEAGTHLRKLAGDNVALAEENGQLKHELRLHKIARRMEERQFDESLDFEEKVAKLKEFDRQKLSALENAIELSAGGFKLGSLKEEDQKNEGGSTSSSERHGELDSFILSQQAYS